MNQDQQLKTILDSFVADIQKYIEAEVARKVQAKLTPAHATANNANDVPNNALQTRLAQGISALEQLQATSQENQAIQEDDLFASLQEFVFKKNSVKETPEFNATHDTVGNAKATDIRSVLNDLANAPHSTTDDFDSEKLAFVSEVVKQQKSPTPAKYVPGIAGLRQLLEKVKRN